MWSNLSNVAGVWNTQNPFDQSRKKHVGCFKEVMDGEFCRSHIPNNNLEVDVDLLAPTILHKTTKMLLLLSAIVSLDGDVLIFRW